jgi:hypothetical protein
MFQVQQMTTKDITLYQINIFVNFKKKLEEKIVMEGKLLILNLRNCLKNIFTEKKSQHDNKRYYKKFVILRT